MIENYPPALSMKGAAITNNLQELLQKWGIAPEAVEHFQLEHDGGNWLRYPSGPDGRYRLLALDGKKITGAKNKWDPKTQHLPMPPLFNIAALDDDTKTVLITNGEKTTMALWTAGIRNVVNTFGEGNRVDDAIDILRLHGIETIQIVPDCDEHGLRAAWKWAERATAAGLKIEIYDLGAYLQDQFSLSPERFRGWDLRDLWLLLDQESAALQEALAALLPLDFSRYGFEAPEPEPTPRQRTTPFENYQWESLYTRWQQEEVIPLLEKVSPSNKSIHKHRHCPNPHHPDKHPSFRITEQGAPVCTCGTISWDDLAGWVGAIPWAEYKQDAIQRYVTQLITDKTLYHFPKNVPDGLREEFLKLHTTGDFLNHAAAALVYDLWHEALRENLLTPEQPFEILTLHTFAAQNGRCTSEKTLRRGTDQLVALGFFVPAGKHINERGRPSDLFRAQPLQKALERFLEVLSYRSRETLFSDDIPDTVTFQWFEEQVIDTASNLSDIQNDLRQPLYETYHDRIEWANAEYQQTVETTGSSYTLENLLAKFSTPLPPGELWRNGRDYRDVYYREKALRRGQRNLKLSTQRAAAQIGVSVQTLRSIRQRTGIATIAQFQEIKIDSPYKVLETINAGAAWAKNRFYGRWLVSSGGAEIAIRPGSESYLDSWTAGQLSAGHQVVAKIQTASLEREATYEETLEMSEKYQGKQAKRKAKKQQATGSPAAETMPKTFSKAYIEKQLSMTPIPPGYDILIDCIKAELLTNDEFQSIRGDLKSGKLAGTDLIPLLTPLLTASEDKEIEKGIKCPDGEAQLPPEPDEIQRE